MRFDSMITGLVTGLLLPEIVITAFYYIKFSEMDINIFIQNMLLVNILSKIISLCVIPNLLLFFLYIWTNKLYAARGVIFATIIYAFATIIIKYV